MTSGFVCDGKISLDTWYNQDMTPFSCQDQPNKKRVYLFSEEKIPIVNSVPSHLFNATIYADYYLNKEASTCKYLANGGSCHDLYWVSTHQHIFPTSSRKEKTENSKKIERFNLDMQQFYEKECGNSHYVDVFHMTNALLNRNEDLQDYEYKTNEFGRTVNLMKVRVDI